MARFVVLLRGVNVGKANRLPMADFRALLEGQGFAEVRTLLNSGNAVCIGTGRAAVHARAIADALQEQVGLDLRVVVKTSVEFCAVVAEDPLAPGAADHSRVLVAFAQEPAGLRELVTLQPLLRPAERLVIGAHAAYLHCADGILESKAASALLGKAGRAVTTRNWATVLKLGALVRGAAA